MIKTDILNHQPSFKDPVEAREAQCKKACSDLVTSYEKIIVLDDDPTGSQTVYGLPVYTGLDRESLRGAMNDPSSVVYILTNSRSLNPEESTRLHTSLLSGLKSCWTKKKAFLVLSRSDSTLRGHYPLETEVLNQEMKDIKGADGEILIPFFKEGGRYTLNDVHYVQEGEDLIPAGETEFARDSSFSFTRSDLKEYVAEKTKGRVAAEDVISISLEDLRRNPQQVFEKLTKAENYARIIVNAVSYGDLKSFLVQYAAAVSTGKHFIFRCAASFVKVIAGLDDQNYLTGADLIRKDDKNRPGLIVAGSYVGKTSRQLKTLSDSGRVKEVRFNIRTALHSDQLAAERKRCIRRTEDLLSRGQTVCLFTENAGSREFLSAHEGEEGLTDLELSARISGALVNIVSEIKTRPSFVMTKGGITSHDIACKALHLIKAEVLGQIVPGVPVWRCGKEAKWPEIPLIIFPGNVGNDNTVSEVVARLSS
ncbi:MAG: four-carbon acid sugar kinase family protein [Spirochaetales bacterium]|nr:four-carbon acid sugar kinase family protein [Spirochaetales bacterium]